MKPNNYHMLKIYFDIYDSNTKLKKIVMYATRNKTTFARNKQFDINVDLVSKFYYAKDLFFEIYLKSNMQEIYKLKLNNKNIKIGYDFVNFDKEWLQKYNSVTLNFSNNITIIKSLNKILFKTEKIKIIKKIAFVYQLSTKKLYVILMHNNKIYKYDFKEDKLNIYYNVFDKYLVEFNADNELILIPKYKVQKFVLKQ